MNLRWRWITLFSLAIAALISAALVAPVAVHEIRQKAARRAAAEQSKHLVTIARRLNDPEVKGVTRYACRANACYFRPVKTLLGDFSTHLLRARRIRQDLAEFCGSVTITSDTVVQSEDVPSLYLRRVSYKCNQPRPINSIASLRQATMQAAEEADAAVKH